MRRTRVKICGITDREDAEMAIEFGADALGFNTWTGSKRFIELEKNAEWISELPPFVARVALVVNAPLETAIAIGRLPFVELLQLHGDENAEYCRQLRDAEIGFIKALRPRSAADFSQIGELASTRFLIDAHVEGQFGGTGHFANLALIKQFQRSYPAHRVVVAGGLRPENVRAVIEELRPYGVDVSSGVESAPGQKNSRLLEAFMREARAADEGQ